MIIPSKSIDLLNILYYKTICINISSCFIVMTESALEKGILAVFVDIKVLANSKSFLYFISMLQGYLFTIGICNILQQDAFCMIVL